MFYKLINEMRFYFIFTGCILIFLILSNCSESPTDPEPTAEEIIDSVIVVGSNVPEDFRQTGQFSLTAIPESQAGTAILSDIIAAAVEITEPENIIADVGIGGFNPPSSKPLAVSVDIDGSGSMVWNDPLRLRVSGAQKFVDVLSASGRQFQGAAFAYQGIPDPPSFLFTDILKDFTANADSLKAAFELVAQNGGTPTYESLLEVLNYKELKKPGAQNERSIVLFSDGEPNSLALKDSVCALASVLDIPIYSIGLGPASDVAGNLPAAVFNMREIARCTGGAYAGISVNNDSTVTAIFSAIANATVIGNADFSVQLSGAGLANITTGTRVKGSITIASGGVSASAKFEFVAP